MTKIWLWVKKHKPAIFLVLLILLALKVFVPQLDTLIESIQALKEADPLWVIVGVIVFFAGVPVLAWQYLELAIKPIKFWLTFRVEMAGLFVSKLLPSSLGTFSLNLYYFVYAKHSVVQSTTVMAMNAFTSGIAYGLIIIGGIIVGGFSLNSINIFSADLPWGLISLITLTLIFGAIIIYKVPRFNKKIKKTFSELKYNLKAYSHRPKAVLMGILLNGIGSLTSLFALYASAHAIGIDLTMTQALVAYTIGNIAAGLVPTPGGLGAAEAGIYSGLILVGVDVTSAITITLLYRLISYWLPILPGYYYFWSLKKTVLSKFSIKTHS